MTIDNPDLFVFWERTDEPSDRHSTWKSQCGTIEQHGFGDRSRFIGFVDNRPLQATTTLQSAKKLVESTYQQVHPLVWNYEGEENRI